MFFSFHQSRSLINYCRHVTPGTLQYYKYHGPSRHLPPPSSIQYHIVLSTYGTVAADFSRGGGVLYNVKWYRLVLDEGINMFGDWFIEWPKAKSKQRTSFVTGRLSNLKLSQHSTELFAGV